MRWSLSEDETYIDTRARITSKGLILDTLRGPWYIKLNMFTRVSHPLQSVAHIVSFVIKKSIEN